MALFAQLRHSARATPRLYRAARATGLDTTEALTSLRIAVTALRVATRLGPGEVGRTNAVRHFVWQSLLTARFGPEVAERLGAVHEEGTPDAEDSRVDLHNNAVGRAYGREHEQTLGHGSVGAAATAAGRAALAAWAAGELIWVRPVRRPRRRRGPRGRPRG